VERYQTLSSNRSEVHFLIARKNLRLTANSQCNGELATHTFYNKLEDDNRGIHQFSAYPSVQSNDFLPDFSSNLDAED
jgi:hypothetical protein